MHASRFIQRIRLMGMSAVLVLLPVLASAQITLEKSDPVDGVSLASAPTTIRFWFSAAPSERQTRIRLTDNDGYLIYLGTVKNFENDERALVYPIAGRLTAGLYHINWTSAGEEGAPASGKITFRVLGAAAARTAVQADSEFMSPMETETKAILRPGEDNGAAATPVYAIARFLSFTSLIIVVSAAMFRFGIVIRAPTRGGKSFDRVIEAAMSTKAAIAAAVFLFVALVRLFLQHRVMVAGLGGDTSGLNLGFMGLATNWGRIWLIQCALVFSSMVGFLLARYRLPGGWHLALVSGVLLVCVGPLTGHSGMTQESLLSAAAMSALHLGGLVLWLGSTFWMYVSALPTLRESGEARARRVADLVNVYGPIAGTGGGLMFLGGVMSASIRLGSLQALWTTTYGMTLIVKLVGVLAIVGIVDVNWTRHKAAIGRRGVAKLMTTWLRYELIAAVVIILISAIVAGLPSPAR